MADFDDLPPLEDMEGLVDKIKEIQVQKNKSSPSVAKIKQTHQPQAPKPNVQSPQKDSFGGMQKGFLFGGKATKKTKGKSLPTGEKVDYVVKPTKPDGDFVFDEVQTAMKETQNSFMANKDQWLTDDLLNKVEGNEKLLKQMADPRFSAAIEWMKRDPTKAMEMYKDDKEVQEFFKEFYKLLGMHFMELGKHQPASTPSSQEHIKPSAAKPPAEDEEKMDKILSDPEIRDILSKPDIQNLFTVLRNDPDKAQSLLNSCDSRMRADIQKLVSAGLLGMEAR